jgi:cytoskeletal protein CcmA (bactofilin family)
MTVVGKISREGAVNVFGRVKGELHASIVRISDGGQVEGIVAAQELSVGGHFKGTIHANRVALTSTAVVEGEIFHRCLVIEENSWFSGVSHPGESLVDASAGAQVNVAPSPSQYAHNGNAQINGPLEKEVGADTPVLPRPSSP